MKDQNPIALYPYLVYSNEVDFQEEMSVARLVEVLIDAASRHAEILKIGSDDLKKLNHAWVLARVAIDIERNPRLGETLMVSTWIDSFTKHFTTRCFKLESQSGELIGYARTVWSIIDSSERTSVDISPYNYIIESVSDEPCPIAKPGKIAIIPESVEPTYTDRVKVSDLDINVHLTSVRYVDYMLDQLPLSTYIGNRIARYEIHFIKEVKYGADIQMYKMVEAHNQLVLELREEAGVRSRCKLVLSERHKA